MTDHVPSDPAPSDRVAVVTGAAKGIGLGVTTALLADGVAVAMVDVDEAALRDALAGLPAGAADRAVTVRADVARPDDWHRVVWTVGARLGPVAVLVNNAGISPKHGGVRAPGPETSLDEWNRVIAVNLTGAFLGIRAVLPDMVAARWGRIVNISSMAAHTGARVAGVHYGASKAGMLGLTRSFAHELAPRGITVNAVAPGRIVTPMAAGVDDEVNRRMLDGIPVGRFGQPRDIGAVVAFLAGAGAGFLTGATIDANGGAYIG